MCTQSVIQYRLSSIFTNFSPVCIKIIIQQHHYTRQLNKAKFNIDSGFFFLPLWVPNLLFIKYRGSLLAAATGNVWIRAGWLRESAGNRSCWRGSQVLATILPVCIQICTCRDPLCTHFLNSVQNYIYHLSQIGISNFFSIFSIFKIIPPVCIQTITYNLYNFFWMYPIYVTKNLTPRDHAIC